MSVTFFPQLVAGQGVCWRRSTFPESIDAVLRAIAQAHAVPELAEARAPSGGDQVGAIDGDFSFTEDLLWDHENRLPKRDPVPHRWGRSGESQPV